MYSYFVLSLLLTKKGSIFNILLQLSLSVFKWFRNPVVWVISLQENDRD